MIHTVRVQISKGPDLRGEGLLSDIKNLLQLNSVDNVKTVNLYRLEGISLTNVKTLTQKLLCEKVNQTYAINTLLVNDAHHSFEIGYKPGVMNPEVGSILKAAKDLGIILAAADTSKEYHFYGNLPKEQVLTIIQNLNLVNPTTEYIISYEPKTLLIKGKPGKTQRIPIRRMSEEELLKLSQDTLFLNLEEMKVIQKYFQKIKQDPTDCELETIAQTWSEHCAHKTFKAKLTVDGKEKLPLIHRIKNEALKHKKHIVSAFVDNSGVMDFYDGMAICGKVETHNSPSAIEPYGGAATGSGGVFRDVAATGLGAKNIVSTDMFCFAPSDMDLKLLPKGCLPPKYLLKRVVAGVRDYGNRMGIPTNNGSLHFHNDFRAKPTVIVGAYGILPKKQAQKGKVRKGDVVVIVGGRTGRDGIHGATFSSAAMTDKTISVNSSAVQIGNAIEQKRMFDAILQARDKGLIRALQDCGAGGFSSAIGELGEKTGVKVDVKKAPLKYQGLAPWEIWLSESQERMVIGMAKKHVKSFFNICKTYNVEATVLGVFDGNKQLQVFDGKEKVCNLSMQFLHHGLPQRTMTARQPEKHVQKEQIPQLPKSEKAWIEILVNVLAHGNVCSKEPIVRVYDHSVHGTNDLQPYSGALLEGPNDAVVIRPLLNKSYGMVVAHGLNPILNNIDPYWGSIWAITEALANYAAVGGNYKESSLINNYIWPFPDEQSLWSLDKSVDAVVAMMKLLKIPVISGKDSLSSTYKEKDGTVIKIPPVLCMSVFGRVKDTTKTVTADFKKNNSIICLVGKLDLESLGGSTYFDIQGIVGNNLPHVSLQTLPKTLDTLYKAIQKKKILACHDVSEGGLIATVFEMCVGGDMGAIIDIRSINTSDGSRLKRSGSHDSSEVDRPDYLLFNETAGCFIVEVADEKTAKILFKNIPYAIIGKTTKQKTLTVSQNKKQLFTVVLSELKQSWQTPMRQLFA